MAKVPDERFLELVKIFNPEKAIPAAVPFIDINASGEKAWNAVRQSLSGADAIVHVVDAFTTAQVDEIVSGYRKLSDEMILSDLAMVEGRLEKVLKMQEQAMGADEKIHRELFPKIKEKLEQGIPLRNIELAEPEINSIKSFSFLSLKMELVVLNITEDGADISNTFMEKSGLKSPAISICCKMESELAELGDDERREFLDSLGIEKPAFERIVRESFSMLGSMYYFTVGEDEVRAWIIKRGMKAPEAAGVIHKDFERGFIKAEVVSYEDFIATGKQLQKAKAAGKMRLEGKEYVVRDGDIINFRFNV
jgi:hypothetical protein